jgi:hypothetical protein
MCVRVRACVRVCVCACVCARVCVLAYWTAHLQTHPVLYMHEMTGPSKACSGFTAMPYFEIDLVAKLSAPVHLVHPVWVQ